MIRKIIGLAVFFAAITSQTVAQELGIELNGGLQGTQYAVKNGESKVLPGGSLGLNYLLRLNSQWGVLTGITGGVYRTQASLQDGLVFTYYEVDDAGSAFRYDVKFQGYKETQQFFAASIPLLIQYHTNGHGGQWYFDGGGKVFLPLNTTIKVTAQQLSLTGYYPDYNIEVSDLPKHGFGTLNDYKGSATTQFKPAAALSAETGFGFRMSPGARLYAGVYVDYGLTDLRKKSDSMPLVSYSAGGLDKVEPNSVLNMRNSGVVKLFSFGVVVRLTFGSAHAKAAVQRKKDTALQVQTVSPAAATKRASPPVAKPETAKPKPAKAEAVKPQPVRVQPANAEPAERQPVNPQPVAPPPAIRQPGAATISVRETEIVQRPVTFGAIGSAELSEAQKSKLDEIADVMKNHPDLRISIVGHTCDDTNETENIKVGEARAKAVAKYLQSKGINRRRMDVSYFRVSDPVQLYSAAANSRNRRVVIMVE